MWVIIPLCTKVLAPSQVVGLGISEPSTVMVSITQQKKRIERWMFSSSSSSLNPRCVGGSENSTDVFVSRLVVQGHTSGGLIEVTVVVNQLMEGLEDILIHHV